MNEDVLLKEIRSIRTMLSTILEAFGELEEIKKELNELKNSKTVTKTVDHRENLETKLLNLLRKLPKEEEPEGSSLEESKKTIRHYYGPLSEIEVQSIKDSLKHSDTELSEELNDKLRKVAEMVIQYGKNISYIATR